MKNLFGIKADNVQKLIIFNYPFLLLMGVIVYFFSRFYHIVPWNIVWIVIFVNIFATLIMHFFVFIKARIWVQTIGLALFSLVVLSSIAYGISCFSPEARPAALLTFLLTIVLQASESLAFGILAVVFVIPNLIILYTLQVRSQASPALMASFVFISVFLMIIAFLANYSFEMLRRKEKEIARIAKINKVLYQMSKTNSDEIVKNMKEALVVFDDELKISRYNQAFAEMASETGDLTGENFWKFANKINLDIKVLSKEIFENKVSDVVTMTTKDKLNNEFETTLNKFILREGEAGLMAIISKKHNPWGKVYDSHSGKPLSMAIIRLIRSSDNKVVETKVTNENGNFGFMVPDGEYSLLALKEGYDFPTKTKKDYLGQKFNLSGSLINFDIALDQTE